MPKNSSILLVIIHNYINDARTHNVKCWRSSFNACTN